MKELWLILYILSGVLQARLSLAQGLENEVPNENRFHKFLLVQLTNHFTKQDLINTFF